MNFTSSNWNGQFMCEDVAQEEDEEDLSSWRCSLMIAVDKSLSSLQWIITLNFFSCEASSIIFMTVFFMADSSC